MVQLGGQRRGKGCPPLAATSQKMQEVKPACAPELQSRRPWRVDKIEELQVWRVHITECRGEHAAAVAS